MIRDRNIVCIASNWHDHPTSKHHVMRWLAAAFTITLIVDLPFVAVIFLIEVTSSRTLGRRVEYSSAADHSSKKKKG